MEAGQEATTTEAGIPTFVLRRLQLISETRLSGSAVIVTPQTELPSSVYALHCGHLIYPRASYSLLFIFLLIRARLESSAWLLTFDPPAFTVCRVIVKRNVVAARRADPRHALEWQNIFFLSC